MGTCTADVYIESATDVKDKIKRIDAIINALISTALKAAATGNVTEYMLDDGQTKISSTYRNPLEVQRSITAFETIKQQYINQLHGRTFRLVDSSNFRR
jgi:hypothetical protein